MSTGCASGRYEAGFARGRSRREVCGSFGPMGGNDADCESSWQTRVRADCGTNVLMKKVISFEILIPYIHSTRLGDQAL